MKWRGRLWSGLGGTLGRHRDWLDPKERLSTETHGNHGNNRETNTKKFVSLLFPLFQCVSVESSSSEMIIAFCVKRIGLAVFR